MQKYNYLENYIEEISIEKLTSSFKDFILRNQKRAVKRYKSGIRKLKLELSRLGVNIKELEYDTKQLSKRYSKQLTIAVNNADKNKIDGLTKNLFKDIGDLLIKFLEFIGRSWLAAFLFMAVLTISVVFTAILISFLGVSAGMIVGAVIVAPIVEEFSKRIALDSNIGNEYIFIFTFTEALIYIYAMKNVGTSLITAILIRIPAVVLHYSTYYIQKTSGETEQEKNKALGIAMLIHSIFNGVSVVVPLVISELS